MPIENNADDKRVPSVPGFWRFGWMVLLTPVQFDTLYAQWRFEKRISLQDLLRRTISADAAARAILLHWFVWLWVVMPTIAGLLLLICDRLIRHVHWYGVAVGVLCGAATGTILALIEFRSAVRQGIMIGLANAVMLGFFSISGGRNAIAKSASIAMIVLWATALWTSERNVKKDGTVLDREAEHPIRSRLGPIVIVTLRCMPTIGAFIALDGIPATGSLIFMFSVHLLLALNMTRGEDLGCLFIFVAGVLVLFIWSPVHAALVFLSMAIVFFSNRTSPGLDRFLVQIFGENQQLGERLIKEAYSCARVDVRSAVAQIQCKFLHGAFKERRYEEIVNLKWPILLPQDRSDEDSPIRVFQEAARDLAIAGRSTVRRQLALERTLKTLRKFIKRRSQEHPGNAFFRETAEQWIADVDRQKITLSFDAGTEVPAAFVAGPPLDPNDVNKRSLFKGRRDLAKLIEHDLLPGKRGLILTFGQRRMGKTSLRKWLPKELGTGTSVVNIDFQGASGNEYRGSLHRWITEEIAREVAEARMPPDSPNWNDAIKWLKEADEKLENKTILVVIDEVERVEDGIRAGWGSTDFLDFLRAAGDSLHNIRFLLLTAYPLYRLGPHWVDRLVSVTSRSISYLEVADARELILKPIPDFPDIYPKNGVERIMRKTGRHPYLIQKTCDELCGLLNRRGGPRKATNDELTEVFDNVINQTDLFDELWRQRTEDEQQALRRVVAAPVGADPVILRLAREGYLTKNGERYDFAVPLFREWIVTMHGRA